MSGSDVHVDTDWVRTRLRDPKVVLVEVHEDISVCDEVHIQGAVKLDWTKDLQRPALRDFTDQAGFEALLSERGIANDDTVILYSASCWLAVYTYWYFKHYGHHSVKLLEGGRKKWELASHQLVTEVPRRPRTAYRVQDTPGPRAITRSRSLTQRLGNGIVRPVDQVLRAVSARVLALVAAVNDHEDKAHYGRFRSIDGRAHRSARANGLDAASSMGFGPVIYSLIETITQANEEV
jgi:3-mercaptopyruvate sulfurtransferase SseA